MDEALAEYLGLTVEIEKKRKAAAKALKKTLLTLANEQVFSKHPELQGFSWTQYTPHFNDGEPCEFGVNEIDKVKFDGYVGDDPDEVEDFPEGFVSYYAPYGKPKDALGKAILAAYEAAEEFRCKYPDDLMLEVYGDGVRVVVTRDKVNIEEYDHD